MLPVGSEYRIRGFEGRDLSAIIDCFVGADGRTLDMDYWEWQYVKNPASHGSEPMIVAEEVRTGEIVGFVLSTPWNLRRAEKKFHATIGSDAFVKPIHRGKGLYNNMIDFLMSEKGKDLGDIRYSFYNERLRGKSRNSPEGFDTSVSLYFQNSRKVANNVFTKRIAKILVPLFYKSNKLSLKSKKMEDIEIKSGDINSVLEIYEKWAETSKYIHTYRNLEYLRWRFQAAPGGLHEFSIISTEEGKIGYIISNTDVKFGQFPLGTLTISDYIVLGNDPDIFEKAVSKIVADHSDIDVVMVRAFSTPEYQSRLRRIGFMDSLYFPLNLWIKPGFMGVRIYNDLLVDAKERESWYLTQSDCF